MKKYVTLVERLMFWPQHESDGTSAAVNMCVYHELGGACFKPRVYRDLTTHLDVLWWDL